VRLRVTIGAMTSRTRSLGQPSVALSLGVLLVSLVALALAGGLLGGPGSSPSAPPGVSASPLATPTATPSPTLGYPTPSPGPTFVTYRVIAGDSLTSIARAFHTTARSIAWWNRGTYPSLDPESPDYRPDAIKLGWVLVILPGTTVDEENPPSPSPAPATPSPSSAVSPTAGPTPTAQVTPAAIVRHGPRTSGKIALTFDMGGRLTPALDIVGWLIDQGVPATIFPTGETGATTTTGQAVLALVADHPELFDLGNHSWDHPYFTRLSAAEMASELDRTEAAIAPLAGQSTKPWFRPPYGAVDSAVQAGVGAAGWAYVDTIDWKRVVDGGPTADDIVAKIATNARAGSIVLMHLGGYQTLQALPGILAAIEALGLEPVTLGELLGQ
jgi:peptidoglycan/xylan/chitin deacetylase (PgdA/CDA1 family)